MWVTFTSSSILPPGLSHSPPPPPPLNLLHLNRAQEMVMATELAVTDCAQQEHGKPRLRAGRRVCGRFASPIIRPYEWHRLEESAEY